MSSHVSDPIEELQRISDTLAEGCKIRQKYLDKISVIASNELPERAVKMILVEIVSCINECDAMKI